MLKNFVIVTLAAVLSGALFLFFALGTLATSVFPSQAFARFLSGLLAGTYYVALAGFLGLFFRAGSNVLLIVLGQGCLLAGLLLSAGHKGAWIDRLAASSFPGLAAKLEFFATAAVFPNLLAGQRPGWPFLGLAVLALVGFGMQWAFLLRLELGRK